MNLDNVYVEFDILKMISCALMIFSGKELLQYSLYVQFTLSTYHFFLQSMCSAVNIENWLWLEDLLIDSPFHCLNLYSSSGWIDESMYS